MAKDTNEITVGANGSIYVAPVGTTVPANIAATLGTGWIDLGYADDNGVTVTDSRTLESIPVWQLFYTARRIVKERDLAVAFVLRQWAAAQVELAFGGGTIVEDGTSGSGHFTYTPPDPQVIDERMLAVEWQDGTKNYRLIVTRGMVTDNVATKIARANAMDLPITFGLIGEAGETPWRLQTDDPAFAPA